MGGRIRNVILAVAGVALFWLSLASAVSLVLGGNNPALSVRLGLPSAEAKAAQALEIVSRPPSSPEQIRRASRLAQAALRREPGNVVAIVVLGTVASLQKRDDLAAGLFAYSERLSRHNTITQLWLIENRVGAGDIGGALIHYDRLMSVKPAYRQTLIPILVQASSDPAVSRILAGVMARRPPWWTDALVPLIFQSANPIVTLPILMQRLRLDASQSAERPLIAAAITRLAGAGAFDEAYTLYLRSGGTRLVGSEHVRNGGFEAGNRLPPFDWELYNEDGRAAVIQPHQTGGSGKSLFLYVDPDHPGVLARQLLLLAPGSYRLSVESGNIGRDEPERPQLRISCAAGTEGTPFLNFHLPVSDEAGGRTRSDFTVPTGCSAQWLSLASGPGSGVQDSPPWIDAVSIQPRGQ